MKIKDFKGTNVLIPRIYHIYFWVVYFTFNVLKWGSYTEDYWYSIKSNLIEFPLHIILVYTNIYFLIPKFILAKKYRAYVLLLLCSFGILYVTRISLNQLFSIEDVYLVNGAVFESYSFNHILSNVLGELYVLAFATSIKLTIDWVFEKRRVEELIKLQLETELNYLKTQIQPHFFFNTLNNLYALTLEKSNVAPSVVLKLSDIMQYVLYDVQESQIRLYDEISYIQNYIDLERLRFGERIHSNTDIKGSIDDVKVPPLLFLPFIENCFKHGAKENEKVHVNIGFEIMNNKTLCFTVENNFSTLVKVNKRHGIGIQNVKRRLELLFENNFQLKTTINEHKYSVLLKIPIQ
jgi:sensor histidine kinase YesM